MVESPVGPTGAGMGRILETKRLLLRELTLEDLDGVAAMLGDAEVMRYWPRTYDRDEARDWIRRQEERYDRDGCGYWLAVERDSSRPVGQAGVLMIEVDGVVEPGLGYIIQRPFWRRGFAAEAAAACRDFTFDALDRPRVTALIRPENLPSRGVAEKIGMTIEKTTEYANYEHLVYVAERHEKSGRHDG